MRILIVYESMFGSTRRVAEAVARGVEAHAKGMPAGRTDSPTVTLREVNEVRPDDLRGADVLIVGGPTHRHGLSSPESRADARRWSYDATRAIQLEPGAAEGVGIRELLGDLDPVPAFAATFDTRASIPEIFGGSAARRAAQRLTELGATVICEPQSFLVDSGSRLITGEVERAHRFGGAVAETTDGLPGEID